MEKTYIGKNNKNKKQVYLKGEVRGLTHKGEGEAHVELPATMPQSNAIYKVRGAYPGDIVEVEKGRSQRKRTKMQGGIQRILYSPWNRLVPFCPVYHLCGGCSMQELSYEDQLSIKRTHVSKLLAPLLPESINVLEAEVDILADSEHRYYYRNRVDYTCGARRWLEAGKLSDSPDIAKRGLGFHVKGFYDKVVHIPHCYIHKSNDIRYAIHEWSMQHDIEYYNSRTGEGWMRSITIRNNIEGEYMLVIAVKSYHEQHISSLCDMLSSKFSSIVSIYSAVNPNSNDSLQDVNLKLEYGAPYIVERCGHILLNIHPQVFYQTNSYMAPKLYQCALDFACFSGKEQVLDLYCGVGSIGLFISQHVKRVLGVEMVEQSVQLARENAKLNNIDNVECMVGTAEHIFSNDSNEFQGDFDVLILDPPRAGLHPKLIKFILQSNIKKIIYVSCNPSTLAKDITSMSDLYQLKKWRAVDMFPHTYHVECVCLLER